jgi:D-3-phosphoglycerate dehydrogenase
MKPGVRIINCARGGLVDEDALATALETGQVAGAALDVYEVEPPPADHLLLTSPSMVLTPHLGASTQEAQENVGIEIAIAILNYLSKGEVANAVNMPSVDAATMKSLAPFLEFGKTLGRVLSQIAPKQVDVLRINYTGQLGELDTSLVSRSILAGYLLRAVGPEQVNLVNTLGIAQKLGLRFTTSRIPEPGEFTDLIEVSATSGQTTAQVCGTIFGGRPRIVRINGHRVEAEPSGTLLMYENTDKPGMIGSIGTLLGKHDINIANMSLSRDVPRGRAVTLLTLDSTPPDPVIGEIRAVDGILSVHCVELD